MHMKNTQTNSGVPDTAQEAPATTAEMLVRLEKLLKGAIDLGWGLFRKLDRIEQLIDIFARQKKRELTPEESDKAAA